MGNKNYKAFFLITFYDPIYENEYVWCYDCIYA